MSRKVNRKVVNIKEISVGELSGLFGLGRFATVVFVKKGNGQLRTLNGKTSVRSALRGGEAPYDAKARGQLRVCDVNLRDEKGKRYSGYRAVTAQNVKEVTSNGIRYVVTDGGKPLRNFVSAISYHAKGKVLTLELNGGKKYNYFDVPSEIHLGLVNAENKGEYFNKNIKGKFDFRLV